MNSKMKEISFLDVSIGDGFWGERQRINSETSIYAVLERFKETGRFEALKFDWKEGAPNRPHIFWDSDVAKWVESAAYVIAKKPDKKLEKAIDDVVDLIEKHQEENGYFNTYFSVVEPEQKFKRRSEHELYCAGHLIEAAVAYYKVTGRDRFLKMMRKYADYIEKVFKIDRSAPFSTCGHEEIELALVKLYRVTGEKRYLELGKFFIESRGKEKIDHFYIWGENAYYAQDHLPVREQKTAEGHAVRAAYLYCAMADLAFEYDDKELFLTSKEIFKNITNRRMYITGGIGSSAAGEAFTIDYDLPNLTAYTESCAAIGLAHFAHRMIYIDIDSVYADTIERILYNGFLSSISLDGKSFFYENPLEVHPELRERDVCTNEGKQRLPIIKRKDVFETSCCPPNITRFVASIANFLYTSEQNTLYVHHYMPGTARTDINGKPMVIIQRTNYPCDGNIFLSIKGKGVNYAAVRIPYWCRNFSIKLNGKATKAKIRKGYAHICLASHEINTIDVELEMKVQLVEASPNVQEDAGRVALQRGPVIYCLEAVDNGGLLRDIRIKSKAPYEVVQDNAFGVPVIKTAGWRRNVKNFKKGLYKPVSAKLEPVSLKFIPYFGFANRGESEMVIWVLKN